MSNIAAEVEAAVFAEHGVRVSFIPRIGEDREITAIIAADSRSLKGGMATTPRLRVRESEVPLGEEAKGEVRIDGIIYAIRSAYRNQSRLGRRGEIIWELENCTQIPRF